MKKFSIFEVASAGLGAQNNFGPLLLMVCRSKELIYDVPKLLLAHSCRRMARLK